MNALAALTTGAGLGLACYGSLWLGVRRLVGQVSNLPGGRQVTESSLGKALVGCPGDAAGAMLSRPLPEQAAPPGLAGPRKHAVRGEHAFAAPASLRRCLGSARGRESMAPTLWPSVRALFQAGHRNNVPYGGLTLGVGRILRLALVALTFYAIARENVALVPAALAGLWLARRRLLRQWGGTEHAD